MTEMMNRRPAPAPRPMEPWPTGVAVVKLPPNKFGLTGPLDQVGAALADLEHRYRVVATSAPQPAEGGYLVVATIAALPAPIIARPAQRVPAAGWSRRRIAWTVTGVVVLVVAVLVSVGLLLASAVDSAGGVGSFLVVVALALLARAAAKRRLDGGARGGCKTTVTVKHRH